MSLHAHHTLPLPQSTHHNDHTTIFRAPTLSNLCALSAATWPKIATTATARTHSWRFGPARHLLARRFFVARDRHGHPVPTAPTDDDALSTEAGAAAVAPSASGGGDGGGGGGGGKKKVANLAYASSNKRAMERVKEIVDALPVGITPRTVLDIGCADGSITGAIAETLGIPPERAHGVDIAGLGEKCVHLLHTAHCVKHAFVDTACAHAHARRFCSAVCK